ncbi:MAG: hypothetical protein AAGE76_00885 [Pseudomonadota bacterium]
MSSTEKILEDLTKASAAANEFVGEFVYAPFGYQSSELVNTATLAVIMAVCGVVIYRLMCPVKCARAKHDVNRYDFGRNV